MPEKRELPDYFGSVAQDVLDYCRPARGIWVDLGSGSGGVGLALAETSESAIVLIDPNADALTEGLEKARGSGLGARVLAVVARANDIPLPDGSVDMVTSRGSIFFWEDPPAGLREVYRILRPGARALIGGGFGSSYPDWAHKEFFRRQDEWLTSKGEAATRDWRRTRKLEWLHEQARLADLENSLIESTPTGRWLLLEKGKS